MIFLFILIYSFVVPIILQYAMARLTASREFSHRIEDGYEHLVRDPVEFYEETFSFPKGLELPDDRFEITTFCIAGDIQSGKTHAAKYLAHICKILWGDNIDFYEADDIFSTIEAIKHSTKYAHFIFIDDVIRPGFDNRRSMSSLNVSGSEKYMIIRHMAREGQLSVQGDEKEFTSGAGYIIIAFASQIWNAIDIRIRKHFVFTLFKTYDEDCEEIVLEEELIEFLKLLKDKSSRCKDWRYRRYGVAVDHSFNLYTPILVPKEFPKIEFVKSKSESLATIQLNECINFLINTTNLDNATTSDLKGILYLFLDRLKKKYRFLEINPGMFTEIITRARIIYKIKQNTDEEVEDFLEVLDDYLNSVKENEKEKKYTTDKLTIEEKIRKSLEIWKVAHVDQIAKTIGEEYQTVSAIICRFSDFVKIDRAIYTLKGYRYTEDEIIKAKQEVGKLVKDKTPMKCLTM